MSARRSNLPSKKESDVPIEAEESEISTLAQSLFFGRCWSFRTIVLILGSILANASLERCRRLQHL